jgi:prolipoprotein diacylglyceryl transferase
MRSELTHIFLAIPAPGSGDEPWGKTFRLYGLMIAIGVIAALELARRRWQARGGDPEDMSALALWIVPAGLIGARLYHVLTDNVTYRGHWFDNPFGDELTQSPLAIWRGGLGIPGGLLFGFLAGWYVARKRGMRIPPVADAIAPGVPLAQAIGRLGNYFNQELFGRPTDLPWGLNVDPQFRPLEYAAYSTFQPTFLYEALWNLALMGALLWIDKRKVVRPGRLFILYIGGYFAGRLWVESLRSDEAKTIIAGLRINTWISLLAMLAVAGLLAFIGLRRRPDDDDRPYVDGHTYDPELALVGAPGEAAADGDTTADEPPPTGAPLDLGKPAPDDVDLGTPPGDVDLDTPSPEDVDLGTPPEDVDLGKPAPDDVDLGTPPEGGPEPR